MTTDISFRNTFSQSAYFRLLSLFAVWLLGILLGSCFACFDTTFSHSLMLSTVQQPMSIVGLFTCVFLPFLISYLFYVSDNRLFLLIICFIKAVAFSYSWATLTKHFGSAAWLITFLFLFSDIFALILLFRLWTVRSISAQELRKHTLFIHFLLLVVFSFADYCVIVPFIQKLF